MINLIWENIFKISREKRSVESILKENPLFKDLTFRELALVQKIVNVRSYRPTETIFKQGEVGLGMYIICSGNVNIYTEELDVKADQIKQNFVTRLGIGDFFGELSLVEENGRRTASAIANEDTVLVGFFKPDLLEIIERNPTAGVKILSVLGSVLGVRLRETTARISELKKNVEIAQNKEKSVTS